MKKTDPNLEALEKSLNESAARLSTIWTSYLIFGLYLALASGNVTHRQLLVANPIKLPALDIELPLVGFFMLAPTLFVILHAYVLIQLALLARTAAAYNESVDGERIRRRLSNTLFAQYLAGSGRDRNDFIGRALTIVVLITVAAVPLFVLFVFQIAFLPYHSWFVTWTHRVLILVDLILIFSLWQELRTQPPRTSWVSFRRWPGVAILVVITGFSWGVLTYAGERHAHWTRFSVAPISEEDEPFPVKLRECRLQSMLTLLGTPTFDRLHLQNVDVVDDERLSKLQAVNESKAIAPHQGERTRNFSGRDMRCANLRGADLRRVDFSEASLRGADLRSAELQGAVLRGTDLTGATLWAVQAEESDFSNAQLKGAILFTARLQSTLLSAADLTGADLGLAQLQKAQLSGKMVAANLTGAQVQGAFLWGVNLRGAMLYASGLHLATLESVNLEHADLTHTVLAGVNANDANLKSAYLFRPMLWRVRLTECGRAQVREPRFDAVMTIDLNPGGQDEFDPTPENIESFVEVTVRRVAKKDAIEFRKELIDLFSKQEEADDEKRIHDSWTRCAVHASADSDYEESLSTGLFDLACQKEAPSEIILEGFHRNWIENIWAPRQLSFLRALARGPSPVQAASCPGAKGVAEAAAAKLRELTTTPTNPHLDMP